MEETKYQITMVGEFSNFKVPLLVLLKWQNKMMSTQMLTQSVLSTSIENTSFFYALEMSNADGGRAYNQGISRLRPNQKLQASELAWRIQGALGHPGQPDPVF